MHTHTQARVRPIVSYYLFNASVINSNSKIEKIQLPVVAVWINDVLLTKMQLVKFVKTKSGFR
jgi:hypothetical protein